jgi:hypothetical protein
MEQHRRLFLTLHDVRMELARCYHDLREGRLETKRGNAMVAALRSVAMIMEQERAEQRLSILDAKIAALRMIVDGETLENLPRWARLPVIEHGAIRVDAPDILDDP